MEWGFAIGRNNKEAKAHPLKPIELNARFAMNHAQKHTKKYFSNI